MAPPLLSLSLCTHWCGCLDHFCMWLSFLRSVSLLMCCVQASVWWWDWCSTSPVLMTRWWTVPESLSSSSITTTAGPLPSLPLPSYSKRSVEALCVLVRKFGKESEKPFSDMKTWSCFIFLLKHSILSFRHGSLIQYYNIFLTASLKYSHCIRGISNITLNRMD